MPEMAIPKMDRDIVYRPFKGQAPQRTIGLVWRTSTAKRAVIEKLAEVLKA